MTLTLDPKLEQRIQHEMEIGNYRSPADFIAHALNLIEEDRRELDQHLGGGRGHDTYFPMFHPQILAQPADTIPARPTSPHSPTQYTSP